jgi:hypothetical protein
LKKILICAAAIGAALVFSAPASARDGGYHGKHYGYAYGHGHARYVMPMRSNRYGMMRGHERARYVHNMNHARRYGY